MRHAVYLTALTATLTLLSLQWIDPACAQSADSRTRTTVIADGKTKAKVRPVRFPFTLFDDKHSEAYAPSGYMGGIDAIKMEVTDENPHAGRRCLKVQFTDEFDWGGVIWQSPANDWGDKPGGWNLSGATALEFYVRGEKGGEVVSFGMGYLGDDKQYPDSSKLEKEGVELTTDWQKVTLPLKGRDLSVIKSGFGWVVANQEATFYLDDIRYLNDKPKSDSKPAPPTPSR